MADRCYLRYTLRYIPRYILRYLATLLHPRCTSALHPRATVSQHTVLIVLKSIYLFLCTYIGKKEQRSFLELRKEEGEKANETMNQRHFFDSDNNFLFRQLHTLTHPAMC
jgi:hypothetical protein